MLYRVNDAGGGAYWVQTIFAEPGEWKAGTWQPGVWREAVGPLNPGFDGLHLARRSDLVFHLGPEIWEAEADGEIVAGDREVVARRARITRRLVTWTDDVARQFASDCVERMVPGYGALGHMYAEEVAAMLEEPDVFDGNGAPASGIGYAARAAMLAFRLLHRSSPALADEHRQWATARLFEFLTPGDHEDD